MVIIPSTAEINHGDQKVFSILNKLKCSLCYGRLQSGGGPRVVVSTAAFRARFRGSVPGLGGLKETKTVSSPSMSESQYCGEPL